MEDMVLAYELDIPDEIGRRAALMRIPRWWGASSNWPATSATWSGSIPRLSAGMPALYPGLSPVRFWSQLPWPPCRRSQHQAQRRSASFPCCGDAQRDARSRGPHGIREHFERRRGAQSDRFFLHIRLPRRMIPHIAYSVFKDGSLLSDVAAQNSKQKQQRPGGGSEEADTLFSM